MKRVLSLALAALMVLSIAACAQDPQPQGEDTTPAVTDPAVTTPAETEPEDRSKIDDLPADLNYNGADFTLYTRQNQFFHSNITVEESTGDQLNDALYDRELAIEERLGLNISEIMSASSSDTGPLMSAIQAGDTTYKLGTVRCVYGAQYAAQGLAYDWDKMEYIDLEKAYWFDSINENLTFAGKRYFAAGSYNLTSYDFTHILMFNKGMITDLNLESPYDLVHNGKWTFDKFAEFGAAAKNDVNGDGKMDLSDTFGYMSGSKQIPPCFWIAAGQQGMYKNENDIPEFTMATDEAFNNLLIEIYELAYDTEIWYFETDGDNIPPTSTELFQQDQALMMDATFYYVDKLREMETDFGIIPYPKYTEEQENYLSRIEGCELPLIPASLSAEEAAMSAAFLEAMASYSAQYTIPTYYDVYLKVKNARDVESAEMLDIVFENRVFDLSDTIWCPEIRDGFIMSMFNANNRNLTSIMKKSTNSVQKAIDRVVKGVGYAG